MSMTATSGESGGSPRLSLPDEGERPTTTSGGPSPPRRALTVAIASLTIAVLAVGAYVVLSSGSYTGRTRLGGEDVPLVRADDRPFKVLPDDPGGREVPNRDKLIYSRLKGVAEKPGVERLLPEPEKPLPLPVAAAPEPMPPVPAEAHVAPPAAPPTAAESAPAPAAAPSSPPPLAAPLETQAAARPSPAGAPEMAPPADATTSVPAALPPAVPRPLARPTGAGDAKPAAATAALRSDGDRPRPAAAASEKTADRPGPGATAAAGGPVFMVQLGALSSPEAVRAHWQKLTSSNGDVLAGLQPTVARVDLGERGVLYRLRAGPVATADRAQAVCRALAGRSVSCVVVSSGG